MNLAKLPIEFQECGLQRLRRLFGHFQKFGRLFDILGLSSSKEAFVEFQCKRRQVGLKTEILRLERGVSEIFVEK